MDRIIDIGLSCNGDRSRACRLVPSENYSLSGDHIIPIFYFSYCCTSKKLVR